MANRLKLCSDPETGQAFPRVATSGILFQEQRTFSNLQASILLQDLYNNARSNIQLQPHDIANAPVDQRIMQLHTNQVLLPVDLKEQERIMFETARGIRSIIEITLAGLAKHHRATAEGARYLAIELGLTRKEIGIVYLGAELHDIGKIEIDPQITCRDGHLTDNEFRSMQDHPLLGYERLEGVFPEPIREAVRDHHRNFDGTGYIAKNTPSEILSQSLSIAARILRIIDSASAMFGRKNNKGRNSEGRLGYKEVISDIERHSGTSYDPEIVEVFTRMPRAQIEAIFLQ